MKKQSLLITGSSGFIGTALLNQLKLKQIDLDIITTGRKKTTDYELNSTSYWHIDLTSPKILLPKQVDTILHMAGEKTNSSSMWSINRDGTRNLLEAARVAQVKRFIYLSSVGVYGASNHEGVVNTAHSKNPKNTYEQSKYAAEEIVREFCSKNSIEYIIIQPSNVIGYIENKSYPLLGMIKSIKRELFTYFGNQTTFSNYINVNDVAAAIIHIYIYGIPHQTYILNTPCPLNNITSWVSDELKINPPSRCLPFYLGKTLGKIGDISHNSLRYTLPFDSARFFELSNTTIFNDGESLKNLDFVYPIGIEKTVRQIVRAYIEKTLL